MIIVEIYIKDELLWGGAMLALPQIGAQLNIFQVPTFNMGDDGAQTAAPPEMKIYQVIGIIYAFPDGYPIMQIVPRLQVIEIDPSTQRPKEPLVKSAQIIH